MEKEDHRKVFLGLGVLILIVLGALAVQNIDSNSNEAKVETENDQNETQRWQQIQLEDVRTGEKYSISDFDKTVMLETFATWCPTCTSQQKEVKKLHEERKDFVSVSLDTDPGEDKEMVKNHIERHGFDWRYSVAPQEMTNSLKKEFGLSFLNPPLAPMALVCENGEVRRLSDGVKTADKLGEELDQGC